ncbi:peroxisome biogenesis protein 5 isoform X2 [Physcomitrium patens]|uniref:Peroxin-5 n=1 Tax=Physcomitrium patens TaxID=3218 RepID=A0A7I4F4H5_PHYPA|nr:peroxisome biogenesis protein 5-like isoform X2 [Physcomitrium patens]|eukprot:XP_024394848.1 peroxisome biogenesis protein 5-like isoform X2 [Physcomitrella patens]
MAFRDLVMGGAGCAVPGQDGASSSNPLGGLADSIIGSASKTQERIREMPGLAGASQAGPQFGRNGPLTSLPGSEFNQAQWHDGQVPEYMRGFQSADPREFTDAWNQSVERWPPPPQLSTVPGNQEGALFSEFDSIYGQQAGPSGAPLLDAPPQRVLNNFLHSFFDSSRTNAPFPAVRLPELGLSQADKRRIRDRSHIMGRHIFADKGDTFVDSQVNGLLHSLDIDESLGAQTRGPLAGQIPEFEQLWKEGFAQSNMQVVPRPPMSLGTQWANEFHSQVGPSGAPQGWADEFDNLQTGNNWANQMQEQSLSHLRNGQMGNMAGMEQTRSLVQTLSQNQDPKFQSSKFLQFVSKMSRGELIVEDNQVKSATTNADAWANEFQQQHPESWAAEFTAGEHQFRGDTWANEFARGKPEPVTTNDAWVDEFSKLGVKDWADEFGDQMARGALGDDVSSEWVDSYDQFVEESVRGEQMKAGSSRFVYQFADNNPYVGHPNPLKEGQELFRRGLLSEAVLALEAEVLKNPDNAEGWRLLGITHAENDDDRQAIASMVKARDADPSNLEVLLALGVSHTNELEQDEALRYLRGWLQHHPKYGALVPGNVSEQLIPSEVEGLFLEAAQMSPEDSDIHTVLGVIYNLSRNYVKAISSFERALQLKPRDYSLWNKLGATQANSSRSAEAIYAYQEALDLKPNYVRAWSNMGIGYANQGLYEESIRYYVRALEMNPKADNAWQYLRISLSIASRNDLLDAVERKDLSALAKEFPL